MKKCRIIDFHTHIFPERIADKAVKSIGDYYGVGIPGLGTAEDLLNCGGKINVHMYVVHSSATRVEQVKPINDFIYETMSLNEKFIGFGTLHPGLEDAYSEVERLMALGLRGIKLHPEFQGFNIDDEGMIPVYRAVEGKLPILMHMGDERSNSSSPERLTKVMDMFPRLVIIAAHLGGYSVWEDSMKHLVGRNVYFDTSSTLWKLGCEKSLEIIRRHGADKILFGTDYPMWVHEDEIKRFDGLDLTMEERELILWKNASELLGIA